MTAVTIVLFTLYILLLFGYLINDKSIRGEQQMGDSKMTVLLQIYSDTRDEIKQYGTQINNFVVQCIVAISALLTIGFQRGMKGTVALALIPLVTLFYCILINSSFKGRAKDIAYLIREIEPKIKESDAKDITLPESYKNKQFALEAGNVQNRKKAFFSIAATVVTLMTMWIYLIAFDPNVFFILWIILFCIADLLLVNDMVKFVPYKEDNSLAFCDYEREPGQFTGRPTKAILFDRDGTLIAERHGSCKLRDLQLMPGARDLVKQAHDKGFKVVVLADQSDVGNNYNSVRKMHLFNLKLRRKLKYVDAIYYCPYDEGVINEKSNPPAMLGRIV
ncbi:MAG: hypothetical protein ACI4A3_02080 [Lachnospiraceae bacterium]